MALSIQIAAGVGLSRVLLMLCWVLLQQGEGLSHQTGSEATAGQTEARQDFFLGPDYLPLQLGNRWIYEREDSRFQRASKVKLEIIARPIMKWTTYYLFNHLPFVPGLEGQRNLLVRYDRATRQFLRFIPDDQEGEEVPLFPLGESADAILDQSLDENDLPVANRLSYLTCPDCENSGLEMVFDRGLGIAEAAVFSERGAETYRLKSALVNDQTFGDPAELAPESDERPKTEVVISHADPVLSLDIQKKRKEVDLLLVVKNPTDHFLSFNFNSSQTYDFVVREKQSGFEVWRWSKGNFFSPVVRSHALLPQKEWKFKAVWNLKDNERNDIKLGSYEAVAILTSEIPRESSVVEIVLP